MVTVKELQTYKNFGRAVEITNGVIRAVVTVDLGPCVVYFGFLGGQNVLWDKWGELPSRTDEAYQNFFGQDKKWELFGGHRMWVAPEKYPETYSPDDAPVSYMISDNAVIFSADPEIKNGISKALIVRMDPDDANMQVEMQVKNISEEDKEFSVWGITVCDKGGAVVIPTNDNDTGFVPNRAVAVWSYTDMSDKRIYWGKSYVTVTQDKTGENPLKIGFDLNKGNAYYVLGDDVFCKSYSPNHKNGVYVDRGASFETYTNHLYLEMETLGELKKVKPHQTATHIEHWSLCKKPCEVNFKDDNSIENFLRNI